MHRQWEDKRLLCKKNLKDMGGFSSFKLEAGNYQLMHDQIMFFTIFLYRIPEEPISHNYKHYYDIPAIKYILLEVLKSTSYPVLGF